jgi:hypothetical protein
LTVTVLDERKRLREDYPHLTSRFRGSRESGECHLRIRTQAFGFFTIRVGRGATQREALLDARGKHDAAFADRNAPCSTTEGSRVVA